MRAACFWLSLLLGGWVFARAYELGASGAGFASLTPWQQGQLFGAAVLSALLAWRWIRGAG